jgi:uncharacterized membrane protein
MSQSLFVKHDRLFVVFRDHTAHVCREQVAKLAGTFDLAPAGVFVLIIVQAALDFCLIDLDGIFLDAQVR